MRAVPGRAIPPPMSSAARLTGFLTSGLIILLVCCACCFGGSGTGAPVTPSGPTGATERSRLLGEITPGNAYGEGPSAQLMAVAVRSLFTPGDGVGVWVSSTVPRRVVVLVEMDDDAIEGLADMSAAERVGYLDAIAGLLDAGFGTFGDEVAIGLRGNLFFGAVYVRHPGGVGTYDTAAIASTTGIDALLAPPAPLAAPVPPVPAIPAPPSGAPPAPPAPGT